jgi:hypothetical protein
MRFLAQFYCDEFRLPLENTLCVHVYQCDPEELPWPEIVRVPLGAKENTEGIGIGQPGILPHDIHWEYKEDPDEATDDDVHLAHSKAGGTCYFYDCLQPGERVFLQLREQPGNFNFGGRTLVFVIGQEHTIRVTFE